MSDIKNIFVVCDELGEPVRVFTRKHVATAFAEKYHGEVLEHKLERGAVEEYLEELEEDDDEQEALFDFTPKGETFLDDTHFGPNEPRKIVVFDELQSFRAPKDYAKQLQADQDKLRELMHSFHKEAYLRQQEQWKEALAKKESEGKSGMPSIVDDYWNKFSPRRVSGTIMRDAMMLDDDYWDKFLPRRDDDAGLLKQSFKDAFLQILVRIWLMRLVS